MQEHRGLRQADLRDARAFAFAEQFLGARFAFGAGDVAFGQSLRFGQLSLSLVRRDLDVDARLRQFGLLFGGGAGVIQLLQPHGSLLLPGERFFLFSRQTADAQLVEQLLDRVFLTWRGRFRLGSANQDGDTVDVVLLKTMA